MRYSNRVSRPLFCKAFGFAVLMAGLSFSGCGSRDSGGPKPTNSQGSGGNPITAPVDYLGAVGKAHKNAGKLADIGLKQAIGQFYAVEGRFPKELNELVTEKYLPSLPPPPAGKTYIYNSSNGELRLE